MRFIIEELANIIYITSLDNDGKKDIIWQTWKKSEFTERKLKNAMKRIQSGFKYKIEFERTF